MPLIPGRAGAGWTEVSASRALLLLPPGAPSGIQNILTGPRKQGQAQVALLTPGWAAAHSGIWGWPGSDQAVSQWSINAVRGGVRIRIHLRVLEALGCRAQVCTTFREGGDRRLCGSPSRTCLAPPLFYCTIYPAPRG